MKKAMHESKADMNEDAMGIEDESKEAPAEHELDAAHDTLMKAESIKSDKHMMKHLGPHMSKKMEHLSKIAKMPQGKITSVEGLKKKAKELE